MDSLYVPSSHIGRADWRFPAARSVSTRFWGLWFLAVVLLTGYSAFVAYIIWVNREDERPEATWLIYSFNDVISIFLAATFGTFYILNIWTHSNVVQEVTGLMTDVQHIMRQVPRYIPRYPHDPSDPNRMRMQKLLYFKNGNATQVLSNQAYFDILAMYVKYAVVLVWQLGQPKDMNAQTAAFTVRNIENRGGSDFVEDHFLHALQSSRDNIMASAVLTAIEERLRDMEENSYDALAANIRQEKMIADRARLVELTNDLARKTRVVFEMNRRSYWGTFTFIIRVITVMFYIALPFFFVFHQGYYAIITCGFLYSVVHGLAAFDFYIGRACVDASEVMTDRIYDAIDRTAEVADIQFKSMFSSAVFAGNKVGYMNRIARDYLPQRFSSRED